MQISKIIIGIDDSKYAQHAAAYGFGIARKYNAEVGLVNIIEPFVPPLDTSDSILGMPVSTPSAIDEVELLNVQHTRSKNVIDQAVKDFGEGLTVTNFSEYGATADGILQCSKEFNADLIVIGTHKRSGLDRLLMGDIAEGVVRHAHVPVLVVPFSEV